MESDAYYPAENPLARVGETGFSRLEAAISRRTLASARGRGWEAPYLFYI
jgi:hypothetical protein